MANSKKAERAKTSRRADITTPRALLRKHARIRKNGRVELQKGWSDKKIAKKAKSEVGLVRRLRGDLYGRIRVEVEREPRGRE